ncbi:MAG: hypothetical protein Q7S92_05710 [Candidatus Diapherotrites archaeon]|nr:hypothetical protein [Candidatus Diapherotrites archaeon]
MTFGVYETETLIRLRKKMEKHEIEWMEKVKREIKENPFTGKPLQVPWFREKKFEGKRLYYLIYENLGKILLVRFAGKKEQQEIINFILKNKKEFEKEMAKI